MEIQFNSRAGAYATNNVYFVNAIPWKDGTGEYYMWNIIVKNVKDEKAAMTDIEVYCKDIPILKMEEMFKWLTQNTVRTPDEIKQYIRKEISRQKCNVYKIRNWSDKMKIIERSKGASTPELQYPGTRFDELSD